MKKALAVILSLALIMSVLVIPGTAIASAETAAQSGNELSFSDAITVLGEDINPRAIRTKELSDGTVAAVYYKSGSGIYYATSDNGGVSFKNDVKLIGNATDSVLATSEEVTTQTTLAKQYIATYGANGRGRLEAQNPNLIELKNGNIAVFYRYNTYTTDPTNKPWSIYYSSICYQILDKATGVWGDVQVVVDTYNSKEIVSEDSDYGFWEPDPVYITDENGNTNLFVYYADTSTPNNLSQQHIMYCVYDEATGKFGAPAIAQNGTDHKSRDGMSVVTKLADGTYAMVFESTRTAKDDYEDIHNYTTFVIKMSFSKDGRNWSDPVIVAKPNPVDDPATTSTEYAVCAAPYVVTLPDGRLAVSYQTTDRYTGRIPNRVSYRIGTQVAVSSQPITSETFANNEINDDVTSYFATELNPGVLGENEFSKSAELMVKDNRLYVYYSVGKNSWTTANGVETEKHDFGDIRMAYIQLPVKNEDDTDYTSLDNYIVYQSTANGTAPTDENGVINIAASGTTNLIAGEGSTHTDFENPIETEVTDLYNEENYTQYNKASADRVTANAEDTTITISGVTKLKFNNTENMGAFKASSILKVRATDGYIQSGYTFHAQDDYFTTDAYNTPGYGVFLRRKTESLEKLELVVRYVYPDSTGAIKNEGIAKTLSTTLSPTDFNYKFRMSIEVTDTDFIVDVYQVEEDGTETKLKSTYTFALDYTATKANTKVYNTGSFYLMTNGATTYSDLSITKTDYPTVDTRVFEKAQNLKAYGVFTLSDATQNLYSGFSFRVQDAAAITAGLSGYTVKLLQTSGDLLKLEISVYELNADKTKCTNKKSYSVDITKNVFGEGVTTAGAKVILDLTVVDDTVTATVTNYNNSELAHTQVYDLNNYYTYAEYGEGGYGIYKHGNGTIKVEDVEFEVLPLNVNNITDDSIYTIYSPEGSKGVTYSDNAFINNDPAAKKIMLNDTLVSDFKADTTLEVGYDGNLKGGIIFRAQNVGNETDEMEGYSAVVYKTDNKTGNYGRIVLLVYKWARLADGTMTYMGTVGSKAFLDTFNLVYPDAEHNLLAAAGAKIKLNVEVNGDKVTTSFDVLNKDNVIAASTPNLVVDLNKAPTGVSKDKVFAAGAESVLYNAGAIGLSISSHGKICDFNLDSNGLGINDTNLSDYVVYSNNSNTMKIEQVNNKIYSTTSGHKQAVLTGRNVKDFDVTATLKSLAEGKTYNIGFDFAINEATHSGTCNAGSATAYMFEGYRVQLTRNTTTDGDLSHTNLRLYKFEKVDNGDGTYSNKRTQLENVANADFFADYDEVGYGNVEVVINIKFVDGTLYASAYVKDHPTRTISYTYTDDNIVNAQGAIGWYIERGGAVTMNNVQLGFDGSLVNAADCNNGFVYAGINSGAAAVGDEVAIVPVANNGYRVDAAYASVNGEKVEINKGDNGYVFTKKYGNTKISATFFLVGDTDNNNVVNSIDVANIRKELLGSADIADKYADINDDTVVSLKDLVKIKKISAGIE